MTRTREQTAACPLRAAAVARGDAAALITDAETLSYAALDARVDATVAALRVDGMNPKDRIAVVPEGDTTAVITLLAILRLGAAACMLSPRAPRAARAAQIARLGARTAVGSPLQPEAGRYEPSIPRADQSTSDTLALDAVATILFTSGSSGEPKPAAHTIRNHLRAAAASNRHNGLTADDRWLLALPLCHVGGLAIVFRCLLAGAAIVIPRAGVDLADAIWRQRVTRLSLVPTQLRRLLDAGRPAPAPDTIRGVLLGGAAAPDALVRTALATGWPVQKSYGLTEMTSQVTTVQPDAPADKRLTSGRLLPGCELRVAADGELHVRGEALFSGYVRDEHIECPTDDDGWFHTGDVGELDADGYLTVRGRRDNLFISGGENIQPEEIEAALATLPGIEQAIVVPIDDDEFGQRPVAFVRAADGCEADTAALNDALARVLPRFKLPVAYQAWPAAHDDGAKVSRPALRELAHELASGRAARPRGNPVQLEDWLQWKRTCAAARCSAPTQARLHGFAWHRFQGFAGRLLGTGADGTRGAMARSVAPAEAWHRFETHLAVHATRSGQAYKEWLFARLEHMTGPPRALLESGASLIVRDAVREFVRLECRAAGTLSLQFAVGPDSDVTLEDLIPSREGALDDLQRREERAVAAGVGATLADTMSWRERIAVLAKSVGMSLADPRAVAAAGCGKTALHEAYRDWLAGTPAVVRAEYPREAAEALRHITALAVLNAHERIFQWGKTEKRCAALYKIEEDEHHACSQTG